MATTDTAGSTTRPREPRLRRVPLAVWAVALLLPVGPAAIAGALRAVSLPFGISTVAQAAAVASLEAEPQLLERVEALVAERERVLDGLAAAGVVVPRAQGNFVWFATGDRTAELAAAADDVGIVVRPFAGEGARVSIGEREANDRVIELARSFA